MKLSKQLSFLVLVSAIGLIILSVLSLQVIKDNLVEARKHEIESILTLVKKQVGYYVDLEQRGQLSREEAEAEVIKVLSTIRHGDSYIWANGDDAISKVHPNPQQLGSFQKSYAPSLRALSGTEFVFSSGDYPKAGDSELHPKINGMTQIREWKWVFGYGIYLDDLNEDFWNTAVYFFIAVSIILIFMVIAAVLIARIILRNILKNIGGEPRYVTAVTNRIAAGNLNEKIEGQFSDNSLLGSVSKMQQSLREMVQNIYQSSAQVTDATKSLNEQMQSISAASQKSSEASYSTSAAIQELSSCIEEIASSVGQTEKNSETSYELAARGEGLVQGSAKSINEISTEISRSTEGITSLQQRSLEIGSIVNVISDIAEQTNLLALNAAIEAARAGESGRGFAVVADEVRTLASRTATATAEITETINLVQADTKSVAKTMESVLPKVEASVDSSGQVSEMLTSIRSDSNETLTKIREVSNSSAEQNRATQALAAHVEDISNMIQETAAAVSNSKENTDNLNKLALELHDSVGYFKL